MEKDIQPYDKEFMQMCIRLSQESVDAGDAPFGSLVAKGDKLIAKGCNDAQNRVSEHAEVSALHGAHLALGTSNLKGCTLYTSAEPCPMCSFMIREYKISRVVFALHSPYMGGHSKWGILQDDELTQFDLFFSPPPEVIGGYLEDEAKEVMNKTIFWMFGKDVRQDSRPT